MDTPEPTESADPVVPIPQHLRPTILDVVERQIEFAADNVWNTKTRDRIVAAVHLWEATVARTLTGAQTVTVADLAIAWIEPRWPENAKAVVNVAKLLEEARELIELRDRALALATERDEPLVVAENVEDPDEMKQRGPACRRPALPWSRFRTYFCPCCAARLTRRWSELATTAATGTTRSARGFAMPPGLPMPSTSPP